ncbi:MAG TPA: AAC(3) family N-acetyltransferase [Levilinea sp.]|nr:AAC(3) family N-acetyltransferase [Levilinea sp.]
MRIPAQQPVLAHASLSAFGDIHGGADTLLGAILGTVDTLVMPTHTYRTMLIPESGPENNAMEYGSGRDVNRMAEFFKYDLPADRLMGVVPETLRRHPGARRSTHPILSFTGIKADAILDAQTLEDFLGPVRVLEDLDGWVLLLGVDHTKNTAIHYAERLAGRKSFTRWALTREGVRECQGFPGCSDGFWRANQYLDAITQRITLGKGVVSAIRLQPMVEVLVNVLRKKPLALLCDNHHCDRCHTIRRVDSIQVGMGEYEVRQERTVL